MIDNERRKKLDETLKGFNKQHKSKIFTMGNTIKKLPVISTGIEIFDDKIGGGFKKGGHTLVWGMYSVGKTALILTAIANAQRNNQTVCYVNTEKPIDPERFEFFGINLNDLIYIEAPEHAEYALEAMQTLCKEKIIDFFIIDSTNGLCPKSVQIDLKTGKDRSLEKNNVASLPKALSEFYNIVNAQVFRAKASVVWIGQARTTGIGSFFARLDLTGGNAQNFFAYQRIKMRRGEKSNNPQRKVKVYFIDDGKLRYKSKSIPTGFDICFKLEKTNSSESILENGEFHLPYYYATGFKTPTVEDKSIPIEVEGSTKKERDIVMEMLKEKGIIIPPEPVETEPIEMKVIGPNGKECQKSDEYQFTGEKTVTVVTKEDTPIPEEKPKKKRGRPAKNKKS